MADIVADFLALLQDDAELTDLVDATAMFGVLIPKSGPDSDLSPPLLVVVESQRIPAARPQTGWREHTLSVDIHGGTPGEAFDIASVVEVAAPTFVGVHATSVVTDCQVESVQPVIDDGWTPTRFRQVVTVVVTAREP
jgi:hypothetical protein